MYINKKTAKRKEIKVQIFRETAEVLRGTTSKSAHDLPPAFKQPGSAPKTPTCWRPPPRIINFNSLFECTFYLSPAKQPFKNMAVNTTVTKA